MKTWKIYRLTFPDGCQYVGQTTRSVSDRVKYHRWEKRDAAPVGVRLRAGEEPDVETLATAGNQQEADTLELDFIADIPAWLRLNRPTIRIRQGSPAPPTDGCYRCTWCQRMTPVAEMTLDQSRSRGIGSKCRPCCRAYYRLNDFIRRSTQKPAEMWEAHQRIKDRDACFKVSYHLSRGYIEAGYDPADLRASLFRSWPSGIWDDLLVAWETNRPAVDVLSDHGVLSDAPIV